MQTIPSSSPAYRTTQHGGSFLMPLSSLTPSPSNHVSQNGGLSSMTPSSSPSSSTPSISRTHIGGSTIPSSPSIDTSSPASDGTQTQTFEDVVTYDALHRPIIIPDGTTGFVIGSNPALLLSSEDGRCSFTQQDIGC
nr:uncharacterized protein LOC104118008 [Nicotiana tomentosiformis]